MSPSGSEEAGRTTDANLLLWIGQILLALAFLVVGFGHSLGFTQASARRGMDWMAAVGRNRMSAIGTLEIIASIGLILPAATVVLGTIAALVAYGRFVVAPL